MPNQQPSKRDWESTVRHLFDMQSQISSGLAKIRGDYPKPVDQTISLISHIREEAYKSALDDMFLEIAKLAEPDERQASAGDLHTNMDNIHKIRVALKPKSGGKNEQNN